MKAQSRAVASSISGYWTEIGARQPRQRPRSSEPRDDRDVLEPADAAPAVGAARRRPDDRLLGLRAPAQDADVEEAPDHRAEQRRRRRRGSGRSPHSRSDVTRDLVQQDAGRHRHVERLGRGSQRDRHPAARAAAASSAPTPAPSLPTTSAIGERPARLPREPSGVPSAAATQISTPRSADPGEQRARVRGDRRAAGTRRPCCRGAPWGW